MTLFKQITLILAFFLGIVLATVMILNFKTANDFVQNQLYTDSKDTATSLGLSISSVVDIEDMSTTETMINAVFDNGYFEVIKLIDMDGNTLVENRNPVVVKSIPKWFIDYVDLDTPPAQVMISDGWMPFGKLIVKSNSGHAYLQLWDTLIDISKSFFLLAVLVMIAMYILLRLVLKTLKEIEYQADAIQKNKFIILDKVPYTVEFRSVVKAMNQMVGRVKEIFQKEAETLKKYYDLLYVDNVTKLKNRRFFMQELSTFLSSENELSNGYLVLHSLKGIEYLKKELGYEKVDETFKKIAQLLESDFLNSQNNLTARLNGTDFAIIAPNSEKEFIIKHCEKFHTLIQEYLNEQKISSLDVYFFTSIASYSPDDTIKTLLSKADFALASASSKNKYAVEIYKEQGVVKTLILGKEEWVEYIKSSIKEDRIKMALQPVQKNKDHEFHKEVYLRLLDKSGEIYSAGYFMPMLISLGLTNEVDKHLFEKVFATASEFESESSFALNVSSDFISDRANMHWLEKILINMSKKLNHSLSFEISEKILLKHINEMVDFSKIVKKFGHKLGIDNFSGGSGDITYLESLGIDYIKADKNYILDMLQGDENTQNNSLTIITTSMGITLIATSVETKQEIEKLKSLGVNVVQGYGVRGIEIHGI